MIQLTTVLNVADNSGARKLFCIQVMGGSRRKWGSIGDVIVASVREAIPNSNIAKGSVVKAVIVRTRKKVRRRNDLTRSEERRVGKECRSRCSPYH